MAWLLLIPPLLAARSREGDAFPNGSRILFQGDSITDGLRRHFLPLPQQGDYWIWDGIHPTYPGHQIMADGWVPAVEPSGV
ncbi:MAG: hypothetical protein LAQ69_27960 [Acidobacteriia bacterium]|nr:hypothetical protein [Terriglobia bacterium]